MPKDKKSKPKKKSYHEISGTIRFDKANKSRAVFIIEGFKGLKSSAVIKIDPDVLPKHVKSGTYSFRFGKNRS